jgi:hypothetical protein
MDKELRELLIESRDAMWDATRRYRISWKLRGDSTDVPGWVAWLDRMQVRIGEKLK